MAISEDHLEAMLERAVRQDTKWCLGGHMQGILNALIILHPAHANDAALLAHKRTHQEQMARVGTLTFWWRYLTDKAFRQASEVEARAAQAGSTKTSEALMR